MNGPLLPAPLQMLGSNSWQSAHHATERRQVPAAWRSNSSFQAVSPNPFVVAVIAYSFPTHPEKKLFELEAKDVFFTLSRHEVVHLCMMQTVNP